MATRTERRIHRLSAACGFIAALSLVVPRFVPDTEGGFASGATAVLVFLGVLFAAAILSLYLLVVTVRAYPEISGLTRAVGVGPSIVLVGALVLLIGVLRY